MLGRDQAGQVGCWGLCSAQLCVRCFLPALRRYSESSESPWAGLSLYLLQAWSHQSWLEARLKGCPRPQLPRAPMCSCNHSSLVGRAVTPSLQQSASYPVSLSLPRSSPRPLWRWPQGVHPVLSPLAVSLQGVRWGSRAPQCLGPSVVPTPQKVGWGLSPASLSGVGVPFVLSCWEHVLLTAPCWGQ